MKAKKLVEVLDAYAMVLRTAGSEGIANSVEDLGKALQKKGGLEVSFVIAVLGDGPSGIADPVADQLAALAVLQAKSGAKKFAIDFHALSSVGQHNPLASGIEQLDLVRYFGRQLSTAPETLKAVQPILKSMSTAGVLDAKQAIAVATAFVGGPSAYKNKKAALEAIRDRVSRNEGLTSKAGMS